LIQVKAIVDCGIIVATRAWRRYPRPAAKTILGCVIKMGEAAGCFIRKTD
jgi:hypothetical protein